MTVLSGILIGLFFLSLGLYVLSVLKDIKILSSISSLLFLPLCCFPVIIQLSNYLPDSHHIRFLSIFAIVFITISEAFIYFRIAKWMQIAGEVLYIISFLFWIQLYKTTFFIFRVSTSALVAEAVILTILLLILLIYIRKQKPVFYLIRIVEFYSLGFLNFSAIITSINVSNKAYPVTFVIGSALLIIEYILFSVQTTRPVEINRKIERAVRTGLITTAEFLMTFTGLLMIR